MSEKQETSQIRILHIADLHLDTPFLGLKPEQSEQRRLDVHETFKRMMNYVKSVDIEYVVICGDLFDTAYATNSTAELLIGEFRNCKENTKVIIAPGRSDCYENNPIYTSGRLPSNCYVFSSDKLSRFDFDDDRLTVYGWAFMGDTVKENPLYDKQVDDISKINIVCGYADLDGELGNECCPISKSDLKHFGADYYAFGSRHDGGDVERLDDSLYSYAGALECTGFDDPGIGGARLITVKYRSGELAIDVKNMSFGRIIFRREVVDITGINSNHEIINRIGALVAEKKYNTDTALQVELVGKIDPRFIVPKNLGSDAFGLYSFEVFDKTVPTYGTEGLKRDMSVKGELYRQLLPMLEGENEEERMIAARAFREGLAALENREIDT